MSWKILDTPLSPALKTLQIHSLLATVAIRHFKKKSEISVEQPCVWIVLNTFFFPNSKLSKNVIKCWVMYNTDTRYPNIIQVVYFFFLFQIFKELFLQAFCCMRNSVLAYSLVAPKHPNSPMCFYTREYPAGTEIVCSHRLKLFTSAHVSPGDPADGRGGVKGPLLHAYVIEWVY